MVTNIAIRVAVLIWRAVEISHLLLQLGVFRLKTIILGLKLDYLLFERRVLLRRQRKALAQYGRRAMLGNEALDFSETGNAHVLPPVADGKETPNVK